MDQNSIDAYEAPAITDIASVHELTLAQAKKRHATSSDGLRFANGHQLKKITTS